jgi:cytochrome b6-f complex iron-sulfur subunit
MEKDRLRRRTFLKILGLGSFLATVGLSIPITVRFLFPRVLFERPSTFIVGRPDDLNPATTGLRVYEDWKEEYGVWIVREGNRLYAINARCTHLGCTPNYFADEGVFKCPCHGSQFRSNGLNFAGPAPRPLDRLRIYINDDGMITVDRARLYTYKDFDRKGAYLKL